MTLEPVGTGASESLRDPNGYTIDRYVGDVEALRSHLGLDGVVLLGHSHGGFVAQAYALAHPERLRGLILYDTSPTTGPEWQRDVEANLAWFEHEPWFPDAKAALASETTATTDDAMTAIFRRVVRPSTSPSGRRDEFESYRSEVRLAATPGRSGTDPSASIQVGIAPVFEVRNRFREINVPTLILVGARDFVVEVRRGDARRDRRLAARRPCAQRPHGPRRGARRLHRRDHRVPDLPRRRLATASTQGHPVGSGGSGGVLTPMSPVSKQSPT